MHNHPKNHSIFMKIPDIKGDATEEGYTNAILLESLDFEAKRTHNSSSQGHHFNDRPAFTTVTLHKYADSASSELFNACCSNNHIETIQIDVCQLHDNRFEPVISYELREPQIVYFNQHVNSLAPLETIKMSYTYLSMTHYGYITDGELKTPSHAAYDLRKAITS